VRFSFFTRAVLLAVVVHGFLFLPAFAGVVEQIGADFKPRSGVIVLPLTASEYLVDLDAAQGIRPGDFLTVMAAGQPIIHPVTKEILGSLDGVKALLQVTQVKSGYSHAVQLSGSGPLTKGEKVSSYVGVAATFWDYTGQGEGLYAQLRAALPQLDWSSYAAAQQSRPQNAQALNGYDGALFILGAEALTVRDGRFTLIASYPVTGVHPAVVSRPALAPAPVPAPATTTAPVGIVLAATVPGIVPAQQEKEEGVWYGPDIDGIINGVAVGNFDGEPGNEIITATDSTLTLGRIVAGQYVAGVTLERPGTRILQLEAVDLDRDGRAELYVTAVEVSPGSEIDDLASFCVELINGAFQVTQSRIEYLFGTVSVPDEGTVLLGQRVGSRGRAYDGNLFRMERQAGQLQSGKEFLRPNDKASVNGFSLIPQPGQPPLYALFNLNDQLNVFKKNGDLMWESNESQGGTEAYIRQIDPDSRAGTSLFGFLKAALKTLDSGLLLVPVNEGSSRVFNTRKFTKSNVIAYRWDGRSLREEWQTKPQGGALAGYTVADVDNDGKDELVMAVIFSHGSLLGLGGQRSTLVVYELP